MGRLDGACVFASETCALDIVGATLRARGRAGRDRRGRRRRACALDQAAAAPRQRSAACSSTSTSRGPTAASSAARSTARAARSAASWRASARRRAPTSCSASPTRPTRRRSASPRSPGCRYELALIRNHYVGRTFIQPTQAGRDAKVKVKYNAGARSAGGQERRDGGRLDRSRHDDARPGRAWCARAGAREVHMRVSSAPITGPCYYGIDTPNREELIAAQHDSPTRSPRHLGVDSLGYLSLDGMLDSVPDGPGWFLPCLLLRRLPDAAPDRSRQAPVRLRLLTPTRRLTRRPTAVSRCSSTSSATAGRGHARHEDGARRQGREPRRDDEPRRAGAARVHDRLPPCASTTCATAAFPTALRDEVDAQPRAARGGDRASGSATRRIRCSSPCAPARPVSMPGMMETILNLGLNDRTVVGLARQSGNARFAYDSYRRFIQMYGDVVLGVPHPRASSSCSRAKRLTDGRRDRRRARRGRAAQPRRGVQGARPQRDRRSRSRWIRGAALGRDRGRVEVVDAQEGGRLPARERHPRDARHRRERRRDGVRQHGRRLRHRRRVHARSVDRRAEVLRRVPRERAGRGRRRRHPHAARTSTRWRSGCPARTRSCSRRRTGSSGTSATCRTSSSPSSAASSTCCRRARQAHRGGRGAHRARDGGRGADRRSARRCCASQPDQLDQLLHPVIDPRVRATPIATGLPASPGAASGVAVFDPDVAEQRAAHGRARDPRARGDDARGLPRHGRRARHPHGARRHDEPRGRRRARHGQVRGRRLQGACTSTSSTAASPSAT